MKETRFRFQDDEHSLAAVRRGARLLLTLDGTTREYEIVQQEGGVCVLRNGTTQLRFAFSAAKSGVSVWVDGAQFVAALVERSAGKPKAAARDVLEAPMTGRVVVVAAEVGAQVARGDLLLVLEAMKMEHRLAAPCDGEVLHVAVQVGAIVDVGAVLVRLAMREEPA